MWNSPNLKPAVKHYQLPEFEIKRLPFWNALEYIKKKTCSKGIFFFLIKPNQGDQHQRFEWVHCQRRPRFLTHVQDTLCSQPWDELLPDDKAFFVELAFLLKNMSVRLTQFQIVGMLVIGKFSWWGHVSSPRSCVRPTASAHGNRGSLRKREMAAAVGRGGQFGKYTHITGYYWHRLFNLWWWSPHGDVTMTNFLIYQNEIPERLTNHSCFWPSINCI